jgi:hypothetical protein
LNNEGKVVLRSKVTGTQPTLSLASLPRGLYTLKLSNGQQQVTHKLMRQ